MEIRQYLLLLRKWALFLVIGIIAGGLIGLIYSAFQPVLYETATKIMVSSSDQQDNMMYYNAFYDVQLAKSYSQIINNDQIRQSLSDRLGYPIGVIRVQNPADSNFITITASSGDPQQAADTANTLVDVFIKYNESLQDSRYKATEDSLQKQISEVESQITTLQAQVSEVNETTIEAQRKQIEEQTRLIDQMLVDANDEVIQIESQLEGFNPTPVVTNTPNPSWIIPTATSVPMPTATLSAGNLVKYKELQARKDQLNDMKSLLQKAYGDLLVSKAGANIDPALQQAQIQNTLALYQQIHSNLLASYENVRLQRLRSTPNIIQVEQATVPASPVQPRPLRNLMMGALAGLMLMGGAAFSIEYLDDTLKTSEDINNFLHLPVLGLIGEIPIQNQDSEGAGSPIYVVDKPLSQISEGFRTLRTNLDFASIDKTVKTFIITSPSPSEGKSTVAINLSAVIAQGERKVLLIDADFRRPSVHRLLGIPNRIGLVDLLRDIHQLPNVIHSVADLPLRIIPSGAIPPNPTELLASERMETLLKTFGEMADIVIVDSPPTILSDPVVLSAKVDGVLIVIRPGKTKIGNAQVMMEQLKLSGARILGVVLNPVSRKSTGYYSKYHYYSNQYYDEQTGEKPKTPKWRLKDLMLKDRQ